MEITSKAQFFQLSRQGLLGNTLRSWTDVRDTYRCGVAYFGLRQIAAGGGGDHVIVAACDLPFMADHWTARGKRFIIEEAAPDEDVQLQGEIGRTYHGWIGRLGVQTKSRMRDAADRGLLKDLFGLKVVTLLEHFVDPSSLDDMRDLLDQYPDAIIEFASYPYNLGKIPRRNTLIWEVRNY